MYAHLHIPLSKMPVSTLFSVIFPVILLGVLNLAIFMQDESLGDRIANIATLMVVFVENIHLLRESVPFYPKITLLEIIIYLETLTTIFCLISSIQVCGGGKDAVKNYDPFQDGLFVISLVITCLQLAIPLAMAVVAICDERYYQMLR